MGGLQATVRDLYAKKDLGLFTSNFTWVIAEHGVMAIKLTPSKCASCLLEPPVDLLQVGAPSYPDLVFALRMLSTLACKGTSPANAAAKPEAWG